MPKILYVHGWMTGKNGLKTELSWSDCGEKWFELSFLIISLHVSISIMFPVKLKDAK